VRSLIGVPLARLLACIGAAVVLYVTVASRGFESAPLGAVLTGAALLGAAASVLFAVQLSRWRLSGPALVALGLVGLIAWPYAVAGALVTLAGLVGWRSGRLRHG